VETFGLGVDKDAAVMQMFEDEESQLKVLKDEVDCVADERLNDDGCEHEEGKA
jgi:hypothetical protein